MTNIIDIAVVGAGPCGLAVGAAARLAGLEAVLFDRGCITSSIVDYPTYMTFFSTPERLELEDVPFVVAADKPTRREALVYYRRVARHFGLRIRQYEEVIEIEGAEGDFTVITRTRDDSEHRTRARVVVLATGALAEPNLLGIPGEESDKVFHTFREPLPYSDQDVLVVGGGNSAVEAALDLFRAGARVTIVHFEDRFDRGVKPWILPDITNRIESGEVDVYWRTRLTCIKPRTVHVRHSDSGEERQIRNDWVFAMTGWRPDHAFLRRLGVGVEDGTGIPTHSADTMETNVPGVFLAGVLVAGNHANRIFIENGRDHGRLIVSAVQRRAEAGDWHGTP